MPNLQIYLPIYKIIDEGKFLHRKAVDFLSNHATDSYRSTNPSTVNYKLYLFVLCPFKHLYFVEIQASSKLYRYNSTYGCSSACTCMWMHVIYGLEYIYIYIYMKIGMNSHTKIK